MNRRITAFINRQKIVKSFFFFFFLFSNILFFFIAGHGILMRDQEYFARGPFGTDKTLWYLCRVFFQAINKKRCPLKGLNAFVWSSSCSSALPAEGKPLLFLFYIPALSVTLNSFKAICTFSCLQHLLCAKLFCYTLQTLGLKNSIVVCS